MWRLKTGILELWPDTAVVMPSVAAEAAVLDSMRARVEKLLPPTASKPNRGRPRHDDRAYLAGIVCILREGVRRRDLPGELPSGTPSFYRITD